jgi:hypothetical protein
MAIPVCVCGFPFSRARTAQGRLPADRVFFACRRVREPLPQGRIRKKDLEKPEFSRLLILISASD